MTGHKLTAAEVDRYKEKQAVECLVDEGGVLAFRPLILHASSPSTVPRHRRVVDLEFAAVELPPPLRWKWRVA